MTRPESAYLDRRGFLQRAAGIGLLGSAGLGMGGIARAWGQAALGQVAPTGARRAFHILVLGDSIMWGQGLREENKFTSLVARWIEARLDTEVRVLRYAHSGAVIQPNRREDAAASTHGEIPNGYPSITAQLATAASALAAPDSVDLVLIDGGINDVGVTNILSTDPTIQHRRAWIKKLTRERCTERMRTLLPVVLDKFPVAKLVATSYFPILSNQTGRPELRALLGAYGLLPGLPGLLDGLADQTQAFHDEYVTGVREVVLSARAPRDPKVRPLTRAAAGMRDSGGVRRVPGEVSGVGPRTAFALVPFRPENCYGASQRWLWDAGEHDEMFAIRRGECATAGGSAANPKCYGAAMGHPNVAGAKAYARTIQHELEQFLPEWRVRIASARR